MRAKRIGWFRFTAWWLLVAISLVIPYVIQNAYHLHVVITAYIFSIAVYGLNLILGYTGQLSLAHGAFMGIGAYASALLTMRAKVSFWLALPLAGFTASFLGFLIGLVSFRTKGHYFAIFTVCVGVIINLIIEKWDNLTGGVRGLIGIPEPDPLFIPWLGTVSFGSLSAQYYLSLAFLIITILVMRRLMGSLVGLTFIAVRDNELLAQSVGIDTKAVKLLSFAVATFFTGIAGALYSGYIRFIGPDISSPHLTFDMLSYLVVGGQGSLAGPFIGTLVVIGIAESLQFVQDYRLMIFGVVIIVLLKYFPKGLAGLLTEVETILKASALTSKFRPQRDYSNELQ